MSPLKQYTEFLPFARDGPRFPLADAVVDPTKTESRRPHVRAFLAHMLPLAKPGTFDRYWKNAYDSTCKTLHSEGAETFSAAEFDFAVDKMVWVSCFEKAQKSAPAHIKAVPVWPWEDTCVKGVASEASPEYARYLEQIRASQAEGSARQEALLDVDQRQRVWDASEEDSGQVGDIVGPFEIQLPAYLPMERCVGASDLEAIQELLPMGLAIRLDSGSRRLTLGFSSAGGPEKVGVRLGLLSVWVHIRNRLRLIYQGQPVTLRQHLLVALSAGIKDTAAEKWDDPLYKDYERANENAIALGAKLAQGLTLRDAAESEVSALIKHCVQS